MTLEKEVFPPWLEGAVDDIGRDRQIVVDEFGGESVVT